MISMVLHTYLKASASTVRLRSAEECVHRLGRLLKLPAVHLSAKSNPSSYRDSIGRAYSSLRRSAHREEEITQTSA